MQHWLYFSQDCCYDEECCVYLDIIACAGYALQWSGG